MSLHHTVRIKLFIPYAIIEALLGMLARLAWGRRDTLGLMNGKYGEVSVKYASLIVSCHWVKVFITA